MKEHLKRLAKGNFIYDNIKVKFSVNEIYEKVTIGNNRIFSFIIEASDDIKGVLWSSNPRITPEKSFFSGRINTITYIVNSVPGIEKITGSFNIVCNGGEYEIPYEFDVVEPVFQTSIGEISDLLHFVKLVQESYDEAKTVFRQVRFKDILIHDRQLENIYDLLMAKEDIDFAIEEFLVAAKKKNPVSITVDTISFDFAELSVNHADIVTIEKSTWGYTDIEIKIDGDFINAGSNKITGDMFTGNRYEFKFVVNYNKLHKGINIGKISFCTYNQTIDVEVMVSNNYDDSKFMEERIAKTKLTKLYLDYRMKKLDTGTWIERSNKVLNKIRGIERDNPLFKLAQAQLFIAQQRTEEGASILDNVRRQMSIPTVESSDTDVLIYCYYLYVNTFLLKNEDNTNKVSEIVKNFYENGHDSYEILWILFYLNNSFSKNVSVKLLRIKDVCHNGCISPIMYFEALTIMNSQPMLLRVLNNFELQVINFGCRYDLVSEELALQVSELIGNVKSATLFMVELLKKLYDRFNSDLILENLVSHMVRNEQQSPDCAQIYEKGILRGLKITRMYEFYIKSLDKSKLYKLPKIVLMYFAYDSSLTPAEKAFIYVNVMKNETASPDIMNLYKPQIEKFCYEQIKNPELDDNLLELFKMSLDEHFIDDNTFSNIIKIMFTYKVKIFDGNIRQIYVKHKEMDSVMAFPVKNNVAYIFMYTSDAGLVFEDESGVWRKGGIRYELEKAFNDNSFVSHLIDGKDNPYFNFYLFENRNEFNISSNDLHNKVYSLISDKAVSEYGLKMLNDWLIDYYVANLSEENFNECINCIDFKKLSQDNAVKIIEMCITNDDYDRAYELINQYGMDDVSDISLMRFLDYMLERINVGEDMLLLNACTHVFENKKYNERILVYLKDYFNGTNEQMYNVRKACKSFSVETKSLEERLLAQMLFSGQHNGRMTEVFGSYYENGGRRLIIDAYVGYHSYLYFVKNMRTNEIVFKAIADMYQEKVELLDVCKLALLKYYSTKTEQLSEEHIAQVESLVNEMCKNNKFFEFFKKFSKVINMPYNMMYQTCIEYRGNPAGKVMIHYYFGNENSEKHSEIMSNCGGVFVKNFIMFYGDSVQYYFTEEINGKTKKTDIISYVCNNINPDDSESRYDYINDMLASQEQHDMVTVKRLMHGYIVKDYITDQIFKHM